MSGELLFLCTCCLLIHSLPHLLIHSVYSVPLCARQCVGTEDTRWSRQFQALNSHGFTALSLKVKNFAAVRIPETKPFGNWGWDWGKGRTRDSPDSSRAALSLTKSAQPLSHPALALAHLVATDCFLVELGIKSPLWSEMFLCSWMILVHSWHWEPLGRRKFQQMHPSENRWDGPTHSGPPPLALTWKGVIQVSKALWPVTFPGGDQLRTGTMVIQGLSTTWKASQRGT